MPTQHVNLHGLWTQLAVEMLPAEQWYAETGKDLTASAEPCCLYWAM